MSVQNRHEEFNNFDLSTQNLNNLDFNGLLLTKYIQCLSLASTEELCLMTLNIDAKFEGKLTYSSKNNRRNLVNFYQSTFKSLQVETFIGSFYPKQKMYEAKIYRGVTCHDNEE